MLKELIKTLVGLCKSCRGMLYLQLCYLSLSALQFEIWEKNVG
jgi:hypothetical protein